MKVILLKDVAKLGKKFDVKNVSDGHALNYLIPRGEVEHATDALIKKIDETKVQEKAKIEKALHESAEKMQALSKQGIIMSGKANEKGHLFAAIHKAEIAAELKNKGILIDEDHIELEKPIKEIGDHTVGFRLGDQMTKIKIGVKKS